VIPWYPGKPIALRAVVHAPVAALVARVHSRFMRQVQERPTALERLNSAFVRRARTEFVPIIAGLPSGRSLQHIFTSAPHPSQCSYSPIRIYVHAGTSFPATLLHGDLYGLSILRDEAATCS
jgi:hypothetical protein